MEGEATDQEQNHPNKDKMQVSGGSSTAVKEVWYGPEITASKSRLWVLTHKTSQASKQRHQYVWRGL